MSIIQDDSLHISVASATLLATQPWWDDLHAVIIEAFLHESDNMTVFPPDWKRLSDDAATAARGLASELGDRGHLAVVLEGQRPVACGGILPYRGGNWIDAAQSGKSDADIANTAQSGEHATPEWEICCFCVSSQWRKRGISYQLLSFLEDFVHARGARRLYASYAEIETGAFWPRMGFEVVPGAGGMLKKGFKLDPGKEGLRSDVIFTTAVKVL